MSIKTETCSLWCSYTVIRAAIVVVLKLLPPVYPLWHLTFFWVTPTYGAFPLRGSARLVTARLGSGRFAFPLQFSTALEWVGLFTCR